MDNIIERARQLRLVIEQVAENLKDDEALESAELFSVWSGDGVEYEVGKRVRYGEENKLYKVLQAHTSQPDWTPTDAPSLFAEVLAGQDGTDIGEWTQPDSTNPYMKGDKVIFEGYVWESLIDSNVWSPSAYPSGWQRLDPIF